MLDEYDMPMQEAYVDGLPREGNEPSDCLTGNIPKHARIVYRANTADI